MFKTYSRSLAENHYWMASVRLFEARFLPRTFYGLRDGENEGDTSIKGYAVVPYIQGVTEPIKRILSICNIKVALKPYLTLGHIFAKPKDPIPTNQKTHAVYSIPCNDSEKEYLGQSKRQFGTRLKEHQKSNIN